MTEPLNIARFESQLGCSALSTRFIAAERKQWQELLAHSGKGPPCWILKMYFYKRLFFEPLFDIDSLGQFLQHFARNSVEVVFHNLYHVTVRIGDRWVDFHFGARREPTIVCTVTRLNLEKPKRAVVKVRNLVSHYGRRHGKELGIGFCLPLAAEKIERLYAAIDELKEPVPFALNAKGGESCLTMLTGLIAKAPELGIGRTDQPGQLFHKMLRHNDRARLVTIYSCSNYSHLKHPFRRMVPLVKGPPNRTRLLELWAREFDTPIPGQLYDAVYSTDGNSKRPKNAA